MHERRSKSVLTGKPIIVTPGIELEEMELVARINLRGDPSDNALKDQLGLILGSPITVIPDRFVKLRDRMLMWLGPDELLITAPLKSRIELMEALKHGLEGRHVAITDVTGTRVRWRLSGKGARKFIAAGCSIDTHPRQFETGYCVQTLFAQCSVTILQTRIDPVFALDVQRSLNRHLQTWAINTALHLD